MTCGNQDDGFATEEAAHLELNQALQDRNIRVNAVRISSNQLNSGGSVEAYLEEVAMAFVYLATVVLRGKMPSAPMSVAGSNTPTLTPLSRDGMAGSLVQIVTRLFFEY
jgi:hypothetical protein